ncbi:Ral guanine nucleotide dissociation stimulator-like 2, partial [Taenia solium]
SLSASYEAMELSAGTLDDIIQYIIEQDMSRVAVERTDTLLLSFHLYTTVYCLLTTLDAKFWQLCYDSNMYPNEKFKLIRFQPIRRKYSESEEYSQSQLIMKARNFIQSMAQSHQLGLAQAMEETCTKINIVSDRFHLIAGLFREANCDKGGPEVSTESQLRISAGEGSMCQLSPRHIAEQFTLYDADLFLKVLPSECLNYVRHRPAPTVDSTIRQFNRIYGLVLTTVIETNPSRSIFAAEVSAPSLASLTLSIVPLPLQNDRRKISNNARLQPSSNFTSCQDIDFVFSSDTSFRAEMLSKWISIAAELRALRSFSAFTAVMTALQGYAISSLHKTWRYVESHYPEKKEVFHDLSQLLNLEDNKKYARELLDHMYSSYEIGRHQDSRHCIFSTIFRRKISTDYLSILAVNVARPSANKHCIVNNSVYSAPHIMRSLPRWRVRTGIAMQLIGSDHPDDATRFTEPQKAGDYRKLYLFVWKKLTELNACSPEVKTPWRRKHEEIIMKTVGTIPYLGIFLNDLAMLHESAPDRVPRRKPSELRRPASGTSLTSMTRDRRNYYNSLYDRQNQLHYSLESFSTLPLPSMEPPRRPPRRKRVNESSDSGTGSACGDSSFQRPPFPVLTDHRSRKGLDNSETGSSTTPTSSGVVIPRDKRSRQVRSTNAAPIPPQRRRGKGASSADPERHKRSISGSVASTAVTTASENDLINFRKHWREYRVLAKLMCLQSSATRYKIREDVAFKQWFESFVLISESRANQKARELEPPSQDWREGMDTGLGSSEVLFSGSGASDDVYQVEESPRCRFSSPPFHSPRLSRLPPCDSSASTHSNDRSSFNEYNSRKVTSKGSLKRSNQKLKHRSSSVSDFNATPMTSPLRAHHQLSSIKKKLGGTLHHARSSSSTPTVVHLDECTRF